MSKTVIIYTTKYNTTKKYAGWLAIKIDADLYELSDIRGSDLKNYDTIIFGAPIENGYIRGVEFIKDNIQKIKDKQIIIFYIKMLCKGRRYIGEKVLSKMGRKKLSVWVKL